MSEPAAPARGARATGSASAPFTPTSGSRWPRLDARVVLAVFLGGCIGGSMRYLVDLAWPEPAPEFPWPILTVNLAGAFVLTLVVVIAAEVRPGRYLRPLLGTGFCGALTTFSSVVVVADQMLGRGRVALAVGYLAATILGGLAAAALGLVVGRSLAANRRGASRGGPDAAARSSAEAHDLHR